MTSDATRFEINFRTNTEPPSFEITADGHPVWSRPVTDIVANVDLRELFATLTIHFGVHALRMDTEDLRLALQALDS